jgi:hypothetical protein
MACWYRQSLPLARSSGPEDDRVCPAFLPRARARAGPIPALPAGQRGPSAGLPAARASSVNLRRLAALAR